VSTASPHSNCGLDVFSLPDRRPQQVRLLNQKLRSGGRRIIKDWTGSILEMRTGGNRCGKLEYRRIHITWECQAPTIHRVRIDNKNRTSHGASPAVPTMHQSTLCDPRRVEMNAGARPLKDPTTAPKTRLNKLSGLLAKSSDLKRASASSPNDPWSEPRGSRADS